MEATAVACHATVVMSWRRVNPRVLRIGELVAPAPDCGDEGVSDGSGAEKDEEAGEEERQVVDLLETSYLEGQPGRLDAAGLGVSDVGKPGEPSFDCAAISLVPPSSPLPTRG